MRTVISGVVFERHLTQDFCITCPQGSFLQEVTPYQPTVSSSQEKEACDSSYRPLSYCCYIDKYLVSQIN